MKLINHEIYQFGNLTCMIFKSNYTTAFISAKLPMNRKLHITLFKNIQHPGHNMHRLTTNQENLDSDPIVAILKTQQFHSLHIYEVHSAA